MNGGINITRRDKFRIRRTYDSIALDSGDITFDYYQLHIFPP